MEFKIGDRIKGIKGNSSGVDFEGQLGTVCIVSIGQLNIGVRWDLSVEEISGSYETGHSCNGLCSENHGWFVSDSEIIKLDEFKVGDRIETINSYRTRCGLGIGKKGTILKIPTEDAKYYYAVRMDDSQHNKFHDCDGLCEKDHGYFLEEKDFKKIDFEPGTSYIKFKSPIMKTNLNSSSFNPTITIGSSNQSIGLSSLGSSSFGTLGHSSGFNSFGSNPCGEIPIPGIYSGGFGSVAIDPHKFIEPVRINYPPMPSIDWSQIHSGQFMFTPTPEPPSPYQHEQHWFSGKSQVHNQIIHNKEIDEFLLLNL